jgi:hypothetical protein|eukprot:COSAG01_NODE_242_length_20582_cov_314.397256_18_plen_52_part_00
MILSSRMLQSIALPITYLAGRVKHNSPFESIVIVIFVSTCGVKYNIHHTNT